MLIWYYPSKKKENIARHNYPRKRINRIFSQPSWPCRWIFLKKWVLWLLFFSAAQVKCDSGLSFVNQSLRWNQKYFCKMFPCLNLLRSYDLICSWEIQSGHFLFHFVPIVFLSLSSIFWYKIKDKTL